MMIAGHQVDDTMFSYIARNLDADTCKLLLKAEPELSFDKSFAVLQIECRRKACDKIPELDNIITGHAHLLNESVLYKQGGLHDILFLLKSFDLDIRMGYPLGTVFGYGRIDIFKKYIYVKEQ